MTVNIATALYKSTGSTTSRSLGDRAAQVINVKDYGAVGNGVADDAAAIQAAFDAAFGTNASPHGNGGGPNNTPVYFPHGTYLINSSLRVTAVWGGRIFGDGQFSSVINYQGQITTPPTADNIIAALWLDGCNFCEISGISFEGKTDPTNHYTACLWFGPDGVNGGSSAHSNLISNCSTSTTSNGVVHGSTASAANSENTYLNCNMGPHEQYGLFISGANSLNMRVIGGAIGSCAVGIKTNNNATAPVVINTAFDGNDCDVDVVSGSTMIIQGSRTESFQFIKNNGSVYAINCGQAASKFTGTATISGTTLTVSAVGSGALRNGMVIYDNTAFPSGGGTAPGATVVVQLTGSSGGTGTYTLSRTAAGALGASITAYPLFLNSIGAGATLLDGPGVSVDGVFRSDGNSYLTVRNNFMSNATALLTGFIGTLLGYDIINTSQAYTVAALPTPASCFKGVRMFVTDSTVAVTNNTNIGAIVAGTGGAGSTVPVWCDGTNWRIG